MAKKRRRRERQRGATNGAPQAPSPPTTPIDAGGDERLPSLFARVAGAGLALLTFAIAAATVVSGFSGDHASIDVAARLFAGLVLIALAIVIAALSLAPRFVRRMLTGG
jgi:hypothetical protein